MNKKQFQENIILQLSIPEKLTRQIQLVASVPLVGLLLPPHLLLASMLCIFQGIQVDLWIIRFITNNRKFFGNVLLQPYTLVRNYFAFI